MPWVLDVPIGTLNFNVAKPAYARRPTQHLLFFCGSSNNCNKNNPPTKRYHDLPGSCVQRVFKHFYSGLWLLLLMWLKHNVECVFIHSMLSFDQKRRLFVDRRSFFFFIYFWFLRVCTDPLTSGYYIYLYQFRNVAI